MFIRILALVAVFALTIGSIGSAADVILNEYNAVSSRNKLDDGDPYFNPKIDGNGGNWFELLIVGDHVDMRGWMLEWNEDETVGAGTDTATGVITLSNDLVWSNLRSGSLVTVIETVDASGEGSFNTATDTSYDPSAGDWWINVSTQGELANGESALVTTVTNDGEPGDFSVGNDDWTLTIKDAVGSIVFGPVGEGSPEWAGGGVKNDEGGSLEGPEATAGYTVDQWQAITPASAFYDDTSSTSFGAANVDFVTGEFVTTQDLSALRNQVAPPLGDGDFNGDGLLDAADINELSLAIRDGNTDSKYDINFDDAVDQGDRVDWVEGIKRTYFGDANFDLVFDDQDFVAVFIAGEYVSGASAGWAEGDWDGNGTFDEQDIVSVFVAGDYLKPSRGAVAAVPEPVSSLLMILGICGLSLVCRRR